MHTMLIRPTKEKLSSFGEPQFVILNAGAFPANKLTTGMGSTTSIDLSIEDKQLIILGTEYAGEMKKGVFTVATARSLSAASLSPIATYSARPSANSTLMTDLGLALRVSPARP
jgi:phosphoenolpyruvate carboxykinase (ATP)